MKPFEGYFSESIVPIALTFEVRRHWYLQDMKGDISGTLRSNSS